jgi:Peptidase inhibitor family I36
MTWYIKAAKVAIPIAMAAGFATSALPAQAATPSCTTGDLCAWVNSGYSGELGHFSGTNADWTDIGRSGGGNWGDVASSGYQSSTNKANNVALWNGDDYSGWDLCLTWHSNNSQTSNFANVSTGTFSWDTFNDSTVSNQWWPVGHSYSCKDTD